MNSLEKMPFPKSGQESKKDKVDAFLLKNSNPSPVEMAEFLNVNENILNEAFGGQARVKEMLDSSPRSFIEEGRKRFPEETVHLNEKKFNELEAGDLIKVKLTGDAEEDIKKIIDLAQAENPTITEALEYDPSSKGLKGENEIIRQAKNLLITLYENDSPDDKKVNSVVKSIIKKVKAQSEMIDR